MRMTGQMVMGYWMKLLGQFVLNGEITVSGKIKFNLRESYSYIDIQDIESGQTSTRNI